MRAWVTAPTLPRGPRSGSWALSAFLVVLVALAHVLACAAHGQAAPAAARAYALPATAPQSPGHHHDSPVECEETGEAGVAAGRQNLPAPAPTGELLPLPPAAVDAALVRPPAQSPWADAGGPEEPGRLRAVLGVWRT
ncbi:hypothetical protein [Streptomyces sp. NPDC053048]|uniref:hypothetical protein n=1 Tax=Streptomyces sp. NPDC053048 TaxID=3365694 RepID=UPI0037D22438